MDLNNKEDREFIHKAILNKYVSVLDNTDLETIQNFYNIVDKELNKKDFLRFSDKEKEYPDFAFLVDENIVKASICNGFAPYPPKFIGDIAFPRYKLIEDIIENKMLVESIYLFFRIFVHLLYKILLNITNYGSINTIVKIAITNLDYLLFSDTKSLRLRDSLDVANYYNQATNTIGYNFSINKNNISLESGLETFTSSTLFQSLIKAFSTHEVIEIEDSDRSILHYILTFYLTVLMDKSDGIDVIKFCKNCNEIFIDTNSSYSKDKEVCIDCNVHKFKLGKPLFKSYNIYY